MQSRDYPYDIETYINLFTLSVKSRETGKRRTFEISERKNEVALIIDFLDRLNAGHGRMVGFNSIGYDYPVVHHLYEVLTSYTEASDLNRKLYEMSCKIINTPYERRFSNNVPEYKHIVEQVDLLKVHHFDNINKQVSLKVLEFVMRMKDIRDLPYPPDVPLTFEQMDEIVDYNEHDVDSTELFLEKSDNAIKFREHLSAKFGKNMMNANDTKIGKDYFVMQLEKRLGANACYHKVEGKRKAKQTKREKIDLGDILFDYVEFNTEPFKAVKRWFESKTITQTKGVFSELDFDQLIPFIEHSPLADHKKVKPWLEQYKEAVLFDEEPPAYPRVNKKQRRLSVMLDGVEFVFGLGGIHASVHKKRIDSDEEYVIVDLDVTSYYPSIAISNRVYPEHLGETFCDIYQEMKLERINYPKGSPENLMLKLALNGVYGDSNNKYSPFYDPQYTMTITVNGQLMLCMLYEQLRKIRSCELIQVNTDGLTVRIKRDDMDKLTRARKSWEQMTGLDLEQAIYDFMHIRDVNNYVAKYADIPENGGDAGKVKLKGAYTFKRDYHQNHSHLVIPKAAHAYLTKGTPVREFIENHDDEFDFLILAKVPRSSRLEAHWGLDIVERYQNTTRYYAAKSGPNLVKVMPPLAKKPDVERPIGINIDTAACECNHFNGIDKNNLNIDWYVKRAEELINFGDAEWEEDKS